VRLCRHRTQGRCSYFCQYKLFTKIVSGTVLVLMGACVFVLYGTPDGIERVRDTALGVGAFLAVVLPLIVVLNRGEPD
jgi:hypothetical protein